MAVLTQLTLNGDGTIGSSTLHDAGTGTPFNTHCNDAPDGVSGDWVANDQSESDTTAYFTLSDVNSDFGSMATLNIDVDLDAIDDGSSNDACILTAQIFDAEGGNPLTDVQQVGDETDGTRVQRQLAFGSLTGNKTQWNAALILFTWDYTKVAAGDDVQLRLYGCDIDGTYTAAAPNNIRAAAYHHRHHNLAG